jgi:hypothetical protein
LAERNLFTPNYGAKKVVRALREEFSVDESLIPFSKVSISRLSIYNYK